MRLPAAPTHVRVLVVEDDATIGRHLDTGLRSNNYLPTWSRTGAGALTESERARYEAVLLDLGLPDMDGLDVARRLRARFPDLLIVILTARTDEIDVIAGLDAGADDYLVKPFSLTVLLARLRAHLRRRIPASPEEEPIRLGDLLLDTAARRCTLHDREVLLRPKEFELLAALARHAGSAVPRETLMAEVWDENWFGPTKTLDVTMATLRRRLTEAAAQSPSPSTLPQITTLRGHGYRLETTQPNHPPKTP
ncbi:response regulator transcription factor [Streptomyces sp. CBMA152]|uniref:response regulator transcription factor n=1 Tax=Streptomyces sp. CBMA152 TaxID=1896312 RepID=UPI0016608975|nr:response regulator transcription factor [Streptomyces sp. CBMA152]MBD0742249.1 DNA-binding response regulator [Streptomyces sp. CBMA152]